MPILNTAQNHLTTRTRVLYLPLHNPNFCSEGLPVLYTANRRWPRFALTAATKCPSICIDSNYAVSSTAAGITYRTILIEMILILKLFIIIFRNIYFNNIKIVKSSILHQPIQKTLINK